MRDAPMTVEDARLELAYLEHKDYWSTADKARWADLINFLIRAARVEQGHDD